MKKILQKAEIILTHLFLITLPWQTRLIFRSGSLNNAYWEYATLSLYALDIIVVAIIILQIIRRQTFSVNAWLLSASLAVALTSVYISSDKILSLFHIAWFIIAAGIVISLSNSLVSKKQLIMSFVIGCALAGFFGLYQFTSQNAPAQKWLGLAAHDSSEIGTSVVETIAPDGRPERWLRSYGPLDHPNIFGGLMALGLIFALSLAKSRTDKKNSFNNIIPVLAIVGLSSGLLVSFSRAAWLAAIVGIIIILSYEIKKTKAAIKNLWLPIVTCLVVVGLFTVPYYYVFAPRLLGHTRLETKSAIERLAGLKESLTIFKTHPIIGSGLGNYGLELHKLDSKELVWFYQPVHNIFALLLAEIGIFGMIIFALLIIAVFKQAWKIKDNRFLTHSLLVSLLILACLDHWLISLHAGIFIGATALGLMLKRD